MKIARRKILIIALIFLFSVCILLSLRVKITRQLAGVAGGVRLEGLDMSYWLEDEVNSYIEKRTRKLKKRPQNASFDRISGDISPEIQGRFVHLSNSVSKVMVAVKGENVELDIFNIKPEITKELLEKINIEVGNYTTYIGSGLNRTTNIRLATKSLDYYFMAPRETFSFNRANGPRTIERGYKPASIIVRGTVVLGIGGGVCQVSTTLYNAVNEADLQIIERHRHSLPIGYVPPGKDATISDYLDFKFRNNSGSHILIRTWTDHRVIIKILTH